MAISAGNDHFGIIRKAKFYNVPRFTSFARWSLISTYKTIATIEFNIGANRICRFN